ncbi:bifunctional diguanylate cyclase/phosphodiesterase [Eubacterium sp. 1001713B170207_170306_E7]|uniref:putative bifunctional diguanylate cyclase/phosphodiesterase n=1 Tax=Eubacterium sp. 1001713B170207_170306_E7 TaxID=2787097 RepID=UPI00189939CF|nr:bifunctional diguanylate cyclase/phosphodiesterase [Eubacterium sp. 1001713B170207_170306_E7]
MKLKISLRLTTFVFCALAIIAAVLSFINTQKVGLKIQEEADRTENHNQCEDKILEFTKASDDLTTATRHFVATGDPVYMNQYWQEADTARHREDAVDGLKALGISAAEQTLLDNAMAASDSLMETEILAMRLKADAVGIPASEMPAEVAGYAYKNGEEAVSAAEKEQLAIRSIFNDVYENQKNEITDSMAGFRSQLHERKTSETTLSNIQTERSLNRMLAYDFFLLLLLLVLSFFLMFFVTTPLYRYYKSLKNSGKNGTERLIPGGSLEIQQFAESFNAMVDDLKNQNAELLEKSRKDSLTGLYNREAFDVYIKETIGTQDGRMALFFMDMDEFKGLNDRYDYLVGDQVLTEVGQRLKSIAQAYGGKAARVGGEEFAMLLPAVRTPQAAQEAAEKVIKAISEIKPESGQAERKDFPVSASVGVLLWDSRRDALPLREVLHRSDLACSRAKQQGKGHFKLYYANDSDLQAMQYTQEHEQQVEDEMYGALARREFEAYYQPKYNIETGEIVGAEALVRWNHPVRGILSPAHFIPVFEANGFVVQLDFYIFKKVCRTLAGQLENNEPAVPVAVNFSSRHFANPGFADEVRRIASLMSVPPSFLEIEITETTLMENWDETITQTRRLREMGFSVALDDFGTGYSSMGVLQELPVDVIKIDRSFINRDLSEHRNAMFITGIVNIARVLKLRIICEGVETREQVDFLRQNGIRFVQGYYYSRPVEEAVFKEKLSENKTR